MEDAAIVKWMSKAIENASRSSRFCVNGTLPLLKSCIEVDGFGPLKLPLKPKQTAELIACCSVAPFGKGTKTLVDKKVRNTFELDPEKLRLGDDWNKVIDETVKTVGEQLGLPADQLEAKLYKLLVYQKGGFFLPHRDSEKLNRMVASMIVVLPNPFAGGDLIIRHGNKKETYRFEDAAKCIAPSYAAFYADCEHEVLRVDKGVRICLAFNLVLKKKKASKSAGDEAKTPAAVLGQSISHWVHTRPNKPLVFALEHHYTQHGLSLDLLKGADRKIADLVVAASRNVDCVAYLAEVTRHLMQDAWGEDDDYNDYDEEMYDEFGDPIDDFEEDEDESERPSSKATTKSDSLEIGETYEDDLEGNQWTDLSGRKLQWSSIPLDNESIVSSIPLDKWKPTAEEYEGYTGNAGNTLDRWYHRSAIVVWSRQHNYEILATMDNNYTVPLLHRMIRSLNKIPKKGVEAARQECIDFAHALLNHWPVSHYYDKPDRSPNSETFLDALRELQDRDCCAHLLRIAHQRDHEIALDKFVPSICKDFGWDNFATELTSLIEQEPATRGRALSTRDVEWLSALCKAKSSSKEKQELTIALCDKAATRFCQPIVKRQNDFYYSRPTKWEPNQWEKPLHDLLEATLSGGSEECLSKVLEFVWNNSDSFSINDCQAPSVIKLIPWTKKRLGSIPTPLATWLARIKQYLENAIAKKPETPTDWTRPDAVECKCGYCKELKVFLNNPALETGRIKAKESDRRHVVDSIRKFDCDVNHKVEEKGSPYSLVLTKNNASFERAVKLYDKQCKLYKSLPANGK